MPKAVLSDHRLTNGPPKLPSTPKGPQPRNAIQYSIYKHQYRHGRHGTQKESRQTKTSHWWRWLWVTTVLSTANASFLAAKKQIPNDKFSHHSHPLEHCSRNITLRIDYLWLLIFNEMRLPCTWPACCKKQRAATPTSGMRFGVGRASHCWSAQLIAEPKLITQVSKPSLRPIIQMGL